MRSDRFKQQLGGIAILVWLLTTCSWAGPVLVWERNPEPDVVGYYVHYSNITAGGSGRWEAGLECELPLTLEPGHAYTFAVTAFNSAGLESPPSVPLLLDATAPTPVLQVSWEPSVFGSIANYTLYYGELNQTAQPLNAGLATSAAVSGLIPGRTYYFYVAGRDAAGNLIDQWQQVTRTLPASGDFGSLHLVRANQPPQVVLTSPTNLANFAAGSAVSFAANAGDPDGTIASVEFYVGATRVATRTTAPYTASWTSQIPGAYEISAVARDTQGATTRSAPVQVRLQETVPSAPSGLSAEAAEDRIRLAWLDTSGNEVGFRVYRLNGTAFTQIGLLPANSVEYLDSGLMPGSAYQYRVTSYNTVGESAAAQIATETLAPILPPPPGSITAKAVSAGIEVNWSLCEGATQYQLERALAATGPFTTIATVTVSSILDTNIIPGTTYYYCVRAQANAFESEPSPIASAIAPAPLGSAPLAPSNLRAAALGKTQLNLTWRDNSNNETSFVVERSLDGLTFTPLATLPPDTKAYLDASVAPRRKYFYRVKAQNLAGGNYSLVLATKTR